MATVRVEVDLSRVKKATSTAITKAFRNKNNQRIIGQVILEDTQAELFKGNIPEEKKKWRKLSNKSTLKYRDYLEKYGNATARLYDRKKPLAVSGQLIESIKFSTKSFVGRLFDKAGMTLNFSFGDNVRTPYKGANGRHRSRSRNSEVAQVQENKYKRPLISFSERAKKQARKEIVALIRRALRGA